MANVWKTATVLYGEGIGSTAERLERRLNALHDEGYEVREILHADPHFLVVAKWQKKRAARVPEVRSTPRTS